jgi:hypothetical protein
MQEAGVDPDKCDNGSVNGKGASHELLETAVWYWWVKSSAVILEAVKSGDLQKEPRPSKTILISFSAKTIKSGRLCIGRLSPRFNLATGSNSKQNLNSAGIAF